MSALLEGLVRTHEAHVERLAKVAVTSDPRLQIGALVGRLATAAAQHFEDEERAKAAGSKEFAQYHHRLGIEAQVAVIREHPLPTVAQLVARAPNDPRDDTTFADRGELAAALQLVALGAPRAAVAKLERMVLDAAAGDPLRKAGVLRDIAEVAGELPLPANHVDAESSLRLLAGQTTRLLRTPREAARQYAEAAIGIAEHQLQRVEDVVRRLARWDDPRNTDATTGFLSLEPVLEPGLREPAVAAD